MAAYFAVQSKLGRLRSSEDEWFEMESYIRPGDIVIDVGANIGRYSLRMSKLVGKDGLVIACEPNRDIFYVLSLMTRALGIKNICLMNCGVSIKAGVGAFLRSRYKPQGAIFGTETQSRVEEIREEQSGVSRVWTLTIDDIVGSAKVGLIKIDVEGGELNVLQGAIRTIEHSRPSIVVETNRNGEEITSWLKSIGYRCISDSKVSRNGFFVYD